MKILKKEYILMFHDLATPIVPPLNVLPCLLIRFC